MTTRLHKVTVAAWGNVNVHVDSINWMKLCFRENIEMLNMITSALASCVRETLQRTEEIQLLYWRRRTSSLCPLVTMTNRGDDCYFFYYSTCTKVSWLNLVWHSAVDAESHGVSCFCRVTVAPSDTARPQSAVRPFAPSGRRGAASETLASFDTWRSRYEKEYIFDALAIRMLYLCVFVWACVSHPSASLCTVTWKIIKIAH